MKLSLNDYADLIIGNVYAGYKGVGQMALSREAVKEEVSLTSRRFLGELLKKQDLDREEFYQDIPKLKLSPRQDLPNNFLIENNGKVFYAQIPNILWMDGLDPVSFVGGTNRFEKFIVKNGASYIVQKYSKYHSKSPVVLISGRDLFLFNGPKGVTTLFVRAIFDNPRELVDDDEPFPIPSRVGDMIITKLTDQFIRHFRSLNPIPNTQNDIQPTQQAKE